MVLLPRRMLRLDGDPLSAKSGVAGGLTTNVTGVVLVVLPLVPVIVSGELPVGVVVAVETVSTDDVPDVPVFAGLNEPVAPAGSPLTLKATSSAKPLRRFTVML